MVKTKIKSSNLTIPSVRLLMHSEYQTLLLETEKGEREGERERGGGGDEKQHFNYFVL